MQNKPVRISTWSNCWKSRASMRSASQEHAQPGTNRQVAANCGRTFNMEVQKAVQKQCKQSEEYVVHTHTHTHQYIYVLTLGMLAHEICEWTAASNLATTTTLATRFQPLSYFLTCVALRFSPPPFPSFYYRLPIPIPIQSLPV